MLGTDLGYAVGETVYRYTAETAGLADLAADAIPVLTIAPNLPNPFSISTAIPYTLARASTLTATIHDVHGRTVRTLIDGVTPPGSGTLVWDGRDVEPRSRSRRSLLVPHGSGPDIGGHEAPRRAMSDRRQHAANSPADEETLAILPASGPSCRPEEG